MKNSRFCFLTFSLLYFLFFHISCAGQKPTPTSTKTPVSIKEPDVTALLAQAASQLKAPNAPKAIHVLDRTEAEWHLDRSTKITVHQIWATRVKPDRPLLPLATLNKDSQDFSIQTLQLYDLDDKGNFVSSPQNDQVQWTSPGPNLPPSLSRIETAHLPDLGAGQALEVKYTLETKNIGISSDKETHFDSKNPRPVPAESSFAVLWNDTFPSLQKNMTLKVPKNIPLYAIRLRIPDSLSVVEDTVDSTKIISFDMKGTLDPLPFESYQPAAQDLAPMTAFSLNKSWGDAVFDYRKRVKQIIDTDISPMNDFVSEAAGNTSAPLMDRIIQIKNLVHEKVDWVDTGLPVYLNPDRSLRNVLESGKADSHDIAVLMTAALKAVKIDAQIYLYRDATSGDLIPDLPALSQLNGVLLAVNTGKNLIWMDPTEPLAAPGNLPLSALGRDALAVFTPFNWKTTPAFNAKDHRKERDVVMELSVDGRMTCAVDLQTFGSADLALREFFRAKSGEKRKEMVLKGLSKRFPGAVLTDYHYGNYQDLTKPLDVHYTFEVPHFAQFSSKGDMAFYPLVFEDVEDFFETLRDTRQTSVVIPQSFNSVTRVVVKLPKNYKVKQLPKDGSISNSVAEFFSNSKLDFGTLSYERYLGVKQRVIETGKPYNELLSFYQTVLGQDHVPFKAVKK
jgi:predicted secreted protein